MSDKILSETGDEEFDRFVNQFDSPAQYLAFLYRKDGEADLRAVMDLIQGTADPSFREQFEEMDAEVAESGMSKCANILLEYAATAQEARYTCPYPKEPIERWTYTDFMGTQRFASETAQAWIEKQRQKHPDYDLSKVTYVDPTETYTRPIYFGHF